MSLSTQYLTVLAMSLCGATMGAVYDVYRTILAEWKYLRWMSSILDFVYWIFALLLVLWALHGANNGDMRLYVFLLLGIGLVLYRMMFRKMVVGSTVRLVLAITYTVKMIYRLFLLVVIGPLVWLWSISLALLRGLDRLARLFEKIILWPFGPLLSVFAWTGNRLYQWTVAPLMEPVLKPIQKQINAWVTPLRKWTQKIRSGWKGFLKRIANWLMDHGEDEDPNQKR